MSLQIIKQENGYKVIADVTVPQVVEFAFESVEDALTKFKELESTGTVVMPPVAPTQPEQPADTVVEPGV